VTGRRSLLELDADLMRALLDELDKRLSSRGIAASAYLVGGAAMTLAYGRDSLTPDIDAVTSHVAVVEEARALATEHGLPEHWLNDSAAPYVPPRPEWALEQPKRDGLTIHIAPARHVLAMKLVALRRKDRPDVRLLITRCGLLEATAEDYADLLGEVYAGEDRLSQVLGVPRGDEGATRAEALAIGGWAHDFAMSMRD